MKQTMVLMLTATVFCLNGCDKKGKMEPQAGTKTEQNQGNPITQRSPAGVVNTGGGNAAAMAVRRGAEIQRHQNDLGQIATFYLLYINDVGRPPAKVEDFIEYIKKDSNSLATALKDKTFTLILLPNPTSNDLLAYETEPYTDGGRRVVMGDKSVRSMDAQEFKKAVKK